MHWNVVILSFLPVLYDVHGHLFGKNAKDPHLELTGSARGGEICTCSCFSVYMNGCACLPPFAQLQPDLRGLILLHPIDQ